MTMSNRSSMRPTSSLDSSPSDARHHLDATRDHEVELPARSRRGVEVRLHRRAALPIDRRPQHETGQPAVSATFGDIPACSSTCVTHPTGSSICAGIDVVPGDQPFTTCAERSSPRMATACALLADRAATASTISARWLST